MGCHTLTYRILACPHWPSVAIPQSKMQYDLPCEVKIHRRVKSWKRLTHDLCPFFHWKASKKGQTKTKLPINAGWEVESEKVKWAPKKIKKEKDGEGRVT